MSLEKAAAAAGMVQSSTALDPNKLTPYVDALPIPPIVKNSEMRPDPDDAHKMLSLYRVTIEEIQQKVHRDLPPTRMWGFDGSSPGPTFETRSGQGLIVEWVNKLPLKHFLPVDHTLHGAEPDKPEVRCVIHLHGGRTPPGSDGYPEDWVVPGKSLTYHYPNRQDAAMLFYHDHTMGINRLNVYAGLQGMFLVRDEMEDKLNLPKGKYEVPLLLCDRFLRSDGQLEYPVSGNPRSPWVPEVYSNVMLANGKLSPYLDVEPRKYRFRVMNGSNARFFRLSFGNLLEMDVIGSDQGLLASPVKANRVLLAPAERTDIVFDFRAYAGEKILLRSDSFDIMQFRVASKSVADNSTVPAPLRSIERIPQSHAIRTRRLTLDESMNKVQQSMGMLLNNTPWHMPVTEKPRLNTAEIWELVNLTEDTHPIHLHLVKFQLLGRRSFNVFHFQDKGELIYTGTAIAPTPEEAGWKDTVRCETGQVTRIIVPFEGYPGRYVWHCHILEHEDNEMMRPYEVLPGDKEGAILAVSHWPLQTELQRSLMLVDNQPARNLLVDLV
ncbi:spore coat protein A [Edaphobacter acidisoli]|uniref:Spore coat protein A n=1 Tax=Edaphobacter acidisoli TaxID=2040573 RepID=A0A916REZ9_9BACT|nr:spore coat protein A [Edaphobacter acidisoli]